MTKVLDFLRGKKATIFSILGAIVVFLLGRGYIQQDLADLISAILVILGAGVNAVDYKIGKMTGRI